MEDPTQQSAHIFKKSKVATTKSVAKKTTTTKGLTKSPSTNSRINELIKVTDDLYVHRDVFKDIICISFEQNRDKRGELRASYQMRLGFRNNAHAPIIATISLQTDRNTLVKKIRNYIKQNSTKLDFNDILDDENDAELEKHDNTDVQSSSTASTAVNQPEKRKREREREKEHPDDIFDESEDESNDESE